MIREGLAYIHRAVAHGPLYGNDPVGARGARKNQGAEESGEPGEPGDAVAISGI